MIELVVIIVCIFSVMANLFILWITVKLYTEFFKERAISKRNGGGLTNEQR